MRLIPIDAQPFDVLQADVVDQRGDANLRPRLVDASEDLFDHLEIFGVVGNDQAILLFHDGDAASLLSTAWRACSAVLAVMCWVRIVARLRAASIAVFG